MSQTFVTLQSSQSMLEDLKIDEKAFHDINAQIGLERAKESW